MRALVVDDDVRIADLVQRVLEREGFEVRVTHDGETGLNVALTDDHDVIILDIRLPRTDGLEGRTDDARARVWTPVLMLTGRIGVTDRVEGLRAGADDYLSKPFAVQELVARVEALVRRSSHEGSGPTTLEVDDLVMDLMRHEVTRAGEKIDLSRQEFDLLELLMRHPGQVMSRGTLFSGAWNGRDVPGSNVVDVYIGYLRDKIDRPFDRESIETVRGSATDCGPERASGPDVSSPLTPGSTDARPDVPSPVPARATIRRRCRCC